MTVPVGGPNETLLRRKAAVSGWASIALRVGVVLGLLLFAIAVHWFERDGLVDELDGHVSFLDVVYFTMISITTTGYGDIVPVTDRTRMFDALVVTPIRIFFVLIFIGTAYTFVIRRSWDRWIMARLQRKLGDHIVVAGFGTSGSEAVDELIARGTDPGKIVVIDASADALHRAESLGCADKGHVSLCNEIVVLRIVACELASDGAHESEVAFYEFVARCGAAAIDDAMSKFCFAASLDVDDFDGVGSRH